MNKRPMLITLTALVFTITGVLQVLIGTEALGITHFGLAASMDAGASGAASLLSGVLSLIVAAGLYTTAGWAYTLVTITLIVRILVDAYAIYSHGATSSIGIAAISNLVVSVLILWYFRRASVKAAFGR